MKKVLIIGLTSILGGVETYIYNVVKFMDKKDLQIDFLIVGENECVFQKELEILLGNDNKHFYFSPSLKKHPIGAIKWLKSFYDKKRYDIVYLNTCTAAREIYCDYTIRKYGTKLITHSHNGNAPSRIRGINNRLFRHHTTQMSSFKLACSLKAYDWLFDDKPNENMIVPNGIDTTRFKFSLDNRNTIRKQLKIDNKIVIGHVGRFSVQKNHQYFLDIASKLDENYVFLFIGDGSEKERIRNLISQNGIAERFIILGAQNDVEKYYSAMDLFAMPSLFEGLPIVAVEAQCNGLHCIFSSEISIQTDISKKSSFISLDDVDKWVAEIKECDKRRYDGERIIMESGFSISKTAECVRKYMFMT